MNNITIKRFDKNKTPQYRDMNIKIKKGLTLLNALYEIKSNQDPSLTFSSGCKSGICGSCGLRVNSKEVLACSYKVQDGDIIEPLNYHNIKRDLVVNKKIPLKSLKNSKAWAKRLQKIKLSIEEEKKIEIQTDCILCNLCYSICPVIAINKDFLAPFALTRVYRYTIDKRENNLEENLKNIQINGIWDCTLCGECANICPQGINPKMDILQLRSISTQYGYNDPNTTNINFTEFNFNIKF